jgi:hypothetical protein
MKSFDRRVTDVEEALRSHRAIHAVSTLTDGYLRRTARLEDTPGDLEAGIIDLAGSLRVAAEDHAFDDAHRRARSLDRRARSACR